MSNYCTHAQIAVLLEKKGGFDTDKTPTATQVDDIIDQTTNEIDTVLSSIGITAQPTDGKLLATLEKYCSFGAAGVVGITYFSNTSTTNDSKPEWYYSKYEKFLEMLRDDPEIFGIISDSEGIYASNQVTDGTISEDDFNDMFFNNEGFEF